MCDYFFYFLKSSKYLSIFFKVKNGENEDKVRFGFGSIIFFGFWWSFSFSFICVEWKFFGSKILDSRFRF